MNTEKNAARNKTVKKIINAAKHEFSRQGFSRATIESITKRAGVGKGTFYLYFKTKEDVIKYMIDEMTDSVIEILDSAMKKLADENIAFDVFFKKIMLLTLREYMKLKDIMLIVVYTNYVISSELNSFRDRRLMEIKERVKRIFELGIKGVYIRKTDPEAAAAFLINAFMYFSIEVLFKEGPGRLEHYVDVIGDMIFHGLMIRREAKKRG